jgi:heme/copper-type cytochrome/quinol oxidase subunit 1
MHDTFYVVAHFHLMLAGATVIGSFGGFYYYFTSFFGIKYSKSFGHVHLFYYTAGIWLTFLPMFFLGFSGLPRRIHDFPAIFMGWQGLASCGHFLTLVGVCAFFAAILDSHYESRVVCVLNLGLPRWQRRIAYYFFKIRENKLNAIQAGFLPSGAVRDFIISNTFNEFDSVVHD